MHRGKKPERKRKNPIRLGVDPDHAYAWSRIRMGGWAVAQSPILGTTITLKRLAKKGYESLLKHYQKVAPQFNPARAGLYTACPEFISGRTAWFILTKEGYGGVRGAPHRLQAARPSTRLWAGLCQFHL